MVFELLDRLLAERGGTFADVVSVRAHLTAMDDASASGRELAARVVGYPPASTTVEVSRLFRRGAVVEVDVTAWKLPRWSMRWVGGDGWWPTPMTPMAGRSRPTTGGRL